MIREFDSENIDISFSIQKRELNILQSSSEALAAAVVIYRALGMEKEYAILCMKELSRRRNFGRRFQF